jgi:hypothetical protein
MDYANYAYDVLLDALTKDSTNANAQQSMLLCAKIAAQAARAAEKKAASLQAELDATKKAIPQADHKIPLAPPADDAAKRAEAEMAGLRSQLQRATSTNAALRSQLATANQALTLDRHVKKRTSPWIYFGLGVLFLLGVAGILSGFGVIPGVAAIASAISLSASTTGWITAGSGIAAVVGTGVTACCLPSNNADEVRTALAAPDRENVIAPPPSPVASPVAARGGSALTQPLLSPRQREFATVSMAGSSFALMAAPKSAAPQADASVTITISQQPTS